MFFYIIFSNNIHYTSVSDPGHFHPDPDPTKMKNTDPDPSDYTIYTIHIFLKVLSDCLKVAIHD